MNVSLRHRIDRRTFLRAGGVAVAVPLLDAMAPVRARAEATEAPRRFVSVSLGLGLHAPNLFPEDSGRDYRPPAYLRPLADLRNEMTVFSGVSHPDIKGGHGAEGVILSAANLKTDAARNSISLDQHLAGKLGRATRYPSLSLNTSGSFSTSVAANGTMIPAEDSPAALFARLFVEPTAQARAAQHRRMRQGRSIMDLVSQDARRLQRRLGAGDRDKLDQYFTSLREMESRLAEDERWLDISKPKVAVPPPTDVTSYHEVIGRLELQLQMIHLALQTDSTRFITLHLNDGGSLVPIDGVEEGYHTLSHHGKDPQKLAQLALIESAIVKTWGDFVRKLKTTPEAGGSLLDRSIIYLTSNLGNASSHSSKNMPALLAGGGFRHGQHLAFDRDNNYPLPNLFVSILQRLGLEEDRFASSTGTMRGLGMV